MSNKGHEGSLRQPEHNVEQQQAIDQASNEGSLQFSDIRIGIRPQPNFFEGSFALLEQQNRNFLELVKRLQMPASELQQTSEICLPKYNPDVAGVDATQWCATLDIILRGKPLSDSAFMQWLSQICYPGITWQQIRQLFEQRYETSEAPAAFILNLLNSRSSNGESLPVFASRTVTSLCTKLRN